MICDVKSVIIDSLSVPPGSRSGLCPEAPWFLLHQERTELAGRLDAREQEEERGRQEKESTSRAGKALFSFSFVVKWQSQVRLWLNEPFHIVFDFEKEETTLMLELEIISTKLGQNLSFVIEFSM